MSAGEAEPAVVPKIPKLTGALPIPFMRSETLETLHVLQSPFGIAEDGGAVAHTGREGLQLPDECRRESRSDRIAVSDFPRRGLDGEVSTVMSQIRTRHRQSDSARATDDLYFLVVFGVVRNPVPGKLKLRSTGELADGHDARRLGRTFVAECRVNRHEVPGFRESQAQRAEQGHLVDDGAEQHI
jgi:hypothetical protein